MAAIGKSLFVVVDLPPEKESAPDQSSRVTNIALSAFNFIKILFISVGTSAYLTLRSAPISFLHIVIGYQDTSPCYFPPSTIPLAALKIARWIFCMGWNFIATSFQATMQAFKDETLESSV